MNCRIIFKKISKTVLQTVKANDNDKAVEEMTVNGSFSFIHYTLMQAAKWEVDV